MNQQNNGMSEGARLLALGFDAFISEAINPVLEICAELENKINDNHQELKQEIKTGLDTTNKNTQVQISAFRKEVLSMLEKQ